MEKKKEKETVGAASLRLKNKAPEDTDAIELGREVLQKNYDKQINECINNALKAYPGNFYIVVETKKERLLDNVLRFYFIARRSCPTPNYDQAVYFYDRRAGTTKFMWCIPDKYTCQILTGNRLVVDIDAISNALITTKHWSRTEEYELLRCVREFYDGTLLEKAKYLNGEN
ncbi:MAG: hypothetical protein ACOC5T_10385 [Elusimicrobiota bacterium]